MLPWISNITLLFFAGMVHLHPNISFIQYVHLHHANKSPKVPSKKMEGNKSTQCDTALATVSAWLAGARIEFKRLVEKVW